VHRQYNKTEMFLMKSNVGHTVKHLRSQLSPPLYNNINEHIEKRRQKENNKVVCAYPDIKIIILKEKRNNNKKKQKHVGSL
jgi:hypothetical protein